MLEYALAFIAGALVKLVDWMDDERKTSLARKLPLALAYGLIIGYLISSSTFSVLFLAALLAQVFARKVDTPAHRAGFLVAGLSLVYFGFPQLDLLLLAIFLVLAFLDELDYIGRYRWITETRPFLKLGALVPAIVGIWDFFIAIAAFDIGYELAGRAARSYARSEAASRPVPKVVLVAPPPAPEGAQAEVPQEAKPKAPRKKKKAGPKTQKP
ncbi:MAG: hypothetical protein AB1529_01105 [Candidatus Micrarchaeota archaeon]